MRKRKRKDWRKDGDTALLRAFPAPATEATFAREGGNPRFFECVVPPVCGWENLPRKKCRAQKSPSFTAHFFAEKEVSAWLCPPHKILLPSSPQRSHFSEENLFSQSAPRSAPGSRSPTPCPLCDCCGLGSVPSVKCMGSRGGGNVCPSALVGPAAAKSRACVAGRGSAPFSQSAES